MNDHPPKPAVSTPPKALRVFIIVASVVVGFGFGLTANPNILAGFLTIVGGVAGGLGGFVSGWFYLAMMKRFERPFRSSLMRIIVGIPWGIIVGIISGSVATEILWIALAIRDASMTLFLTSGQTAVIYFGAPAGAVTGLICTCLWLAIVPAKITSEKEVS
ncbi:MAG: hypothetical protein K8S55_06565 [Phycisphaerae bacterium]|nr:hypothetical protein [Phycisphaerae bacterium]